jgi:hypothetical protein
MYHHIFGLADGLDVVTVVVLSMVDLDVVVSDIQKNLYVVN